MIVRDKIPIGVNVNSDTFNNLYKLLKYDLEFHLFGDFNKIKECIKYMTPYKKSVIVHCNELLHEDLLSWFVENNICLSVDITNLSKIDTITKLPKYKNLLIEIDSNFNIDTLKNLIYYYNEYNKYKCGVIIESSSKDDFFEVLRSELSYHCYTDIIESLIRKYSMIKICGFIIPYRELFYTTDDYCINFKDIKTPITMIDDFYDFYKDLYTIDNKCEECIVSSHCNKYSVICENELLFYTDVIKMMLNKMESV